MNEEQIADVWLLFKEYLDKNHVEMAAERFVDMLADYGLSDLAFQELLGNDTVLDTAINYYLEVDDDLHDDEEEDKHDSTRDADSFFNLPDDDGDDDE